MPQRDGWQPGDPWEAWAPLEGRTRLRSVEACEREAWSLVSWPRGAIDLEAGSLDASRGEPVARPFLCGSWRCRRCARLRGASDFVRARDALLGRRWWVYVVLTFDPSRYASPWDAYRAAGTCWDDHLRESMRRKGGRIEYLSTWEAHRSRWPHANYLLTGDQLRAWIDSLGVVEREHRSPISDRVRRCLLPRGWRRWLRAAAVRAGFGPVVWAELVTPRNPEALAGYFVKLARELTGGVGGEKGEQSPIDAPKHFRRIRASRGLLPRSKLRPEPGGPFEGALWRGRSVKEPSPARAPGQRPAPHPTTWAHAFALLEQEAVRRAEAWGGLESGDAKCSASSCETVNTEDGQVPRVRRDVRSAGSAGSPHQRARRGRREPASSVSEVDAGEQAGDATGSCT